MTVHQVDLFRIQMRGPGDISGLHALVGEGRIDPKDIVAILGKTEGNGGVNDFTREYASKTFAAALAEYLGCTRDEVESRVALVMSGGTEGVLSPHATVFVRRAVAKKESGGKRLAIGVAHTRDFLPEELGTQKQIAETAQAVREAMSDAGIADVSDVHFVQIKCPLLTAERVEDAKRRGHATVTADSYASMAYSRGASALGVALGLGEIDEAAALESAVLSNWSHYSSVASTSAGVELFCNAIVVMGNSASAAGDNIIGHSVMRDAIDLRGVLEAFHSVGFDAASVLSGEAGARVLNVFAKAEPSPEGLIRGMRHTMLDDSDINCTRHARAAVGGLVASVAGCGSVYISGGAEHQGPPGGGPIAVIAKSIAMS
ncbi:ring-opening amidohydrolase [Herbaspirillum sp. CAH-3]|uniref:cyanuric acid amidohydrolase n=1 Tax=Herbaspirillum sp. CAH-3 TaxID=2605746 RepID=UPI0012AC7008|nr:ring-opening amidohydrolase [Herbaspirillum sp. CAH-3]MRT30934.1 ring-opening amidohydrolase [Herbaspirillum sp. CAH-3]